jgi:hypothetical protein
VRDVATFEPICRNTASGRFKHFAIHPARPGSGAEPAASRYFEWPLSAMRSFAAARALYLAREKLGAGREWSDKGGHVHVQNQQRDQRQAPWNKGRLVDQKRPLKPKEVWNIRARLQIDARRRDLAMFNLAIDSKLRGCDLVRLKIDDLCVGGRLRDRATKRPVTPNSAQAGFDFQ